MWTEPDMAFTGTGAMNGLAADTADGTCGDDRAGGDRPGGHMRLTVLMDNRIVDPLGLGRLLALGLGAVTGEGRRDLRDDFDALMRSRSISNCHI